MLSSLPNKPKIEMVQGAAGSVKVILRIPVAKQGEFISFERIYYQSTDKPNEEQNKGVIVEHQFGVTLFPFIKTNNPNIEAYYRVQLVDRDVTGILKNTDYDLKFFSNIEHDAVDVRAKKTRSSKNLMQLRQPHHNTMYYTMNLIIFKSKMWWLQVLRE